MGGGVKVSFLTFYFTSYYLRPAHYLTTRLSFDNLQHWSFDNVFRNVSNLIWSEIHCVRRVKTFGFISLN